jgi:hypothetical protein
MADSELPEIKLAGEKYVITWLTENGYADVIKEMLKSDEYALKVSGKIENILVQVRTFLHPHRPFKLSDYEVDLIIRRAAKLKLVAYAAYVILNTNGNLNEDIIWERLS